MHSTHFKQGPGIWGLSLSPLVWARHDQGSTLPGVHSTSLAEQWPLKRPFDSKIIGLKEVNVNVYEKRRSIIINFPKSSRHCGMLGHLCHGRAPGHEIYVCPCSKGDFAEIDKGNGPKRSRTDIHHVTFTCNEEVQSLIR